MCKESLGSQERFDKKKSCLATVWREGVVRDGDKGSGAVILRAKWEKRKGREASGESRQRPSSAATRAPGIAVDPTADVALTLPSNLSNLPISLPPLAQSASRPGPIEAQSKKSSSDAHVLWPGQRAL